MSQAMATYNFSSLVDVLNHQSSQKKNFMECPFSQTNNGLGKAYEDPNVTEMFGELYFKEVSPPSSLHSLFPSFPFPFPLSSSLSSSLPDPTLDPTNYIQKLNCDANHDKKKKKKKSNGENWGSAENKCCYDTKSTSWTSKERLFPPPVSSLKLFKIGKPFVYFKLNEKTGRFVREEIRIPPQGFLFGSRENGCLKLNSAHKEEKEEEEEKEKDHESEEA